MATSVLTLLQEGQAEAAAPLACAAAHGASGASFFEANALAAMTLTKAGYSDASLDYWNKIIRSAPHKLQWLESGLRSAWQAEKENEKAAKYARKWEEMLERVYIDIPSINLLAQLQQRGWRGKGCIGIHDGFLKGWLWLKNGVKPQIIAETPKALEFSPILKAVARSADNILYKLNYKLTPLDFAYRVNIADEGGEQVSGSPITISAPAAAKTAKKAKGDKRRVTIIIPVYDDATATLACIGNLCASLKKNQIQPAIIIAWDHGPNQNLLLRLGKLAQRKKILLLVNNSNQGFIANVNNALKEVDDGEVILLNSDTIVYGNWIDRLVEAAKLPNAATVTALSNEAELMSYPSATDRGKINRLSQTRILDNAAASTGARAVEIPVGVGFCMLITRAALNALGGFDGNRLFRGYGEEVDFCLRAASAGFKNYGAFNVFVGHLGERSFGVSKKALASQNNDAIFQRFPGYRRGYEVFMLDSGPKKIRESISLAALKDIPEINTLEIRPWSQRFLPPWAKDEQCQPERKGAALFIQTGPSSRAILRVWSEIPIAEMNFDLKTDITILRKALTDLGCRQGCVYGQSRALQTEAQTLGIELTQAVAPEDLAQFAGLDKGNYLAAPPASVKDWRNLCDLALKMPKQRFYVFYIDTLWRGAPRPENLQEVPAMEDYRPLAARAFLMAGDSHDAPAWRYWLDCHSCADLPVFRIGDD